MFGKHLKVIEEEYLPRFKNNYGLFKFRLLNLKATKNLFMDVLEELTQKQFYKKVEGLK